MKKLVFLLFLVLTTPLFSQFHTNGSRSELGVLLGGSYYIGDLNRYEHFKNTQLAFGIVYRYNIHSRLAFRTNFSYGNVLADDAQAKSDLLRNRNLRFQSDIFELAAGLEFNYFPFQLGHDRYKGTAYLLAELGVFKMNPATNHNGELVELQALGTEGQGSTLSSKNKYSLIQVGIPLGIGAKISLGKRASLGLEYRITKTFTDYLDDVGADSFIERGELEDANGPLAAELSNQNLNGDAYGKRGNSSTKDWYSFFGAMLTIRLGSPASCQYQW